VLHQTRPKQLYAFEINKLRDVATLQPTATMPIKFKLYGQVGFRLLLLTLRRGASLHAGKVQT